MAFLLLDPTFDWPKNERAYDDLLLVPDGQEDIMRLWFSFITFPLSAPPTFAATPRLESTWSTITQSQFCQLLDKSSFADPLQQIIE